ncbi:MAG: hypothetical protein ABSC51_07045 [Gaiellaceae bacterium]|jgi:hypothetical protein
MKRAQLAVLALLVVGVLPAAASLSPKATSILSERGTITEISADGSRVAAVETATNACFKIVVWNTATKKTVRFKTGVNCPGDGGAMNEVPGIALAGTRVAWIEGVGGNDLELSVHSRVLGARKSAMVSAYTSNGNGAGEQPDGGYVENVVGHGGLLVYNSWSVCSAVPAREPAEDWLATCVQPAPADREILIYSDQRLEKIVGSKSVVIRSSPDAQAPYSYDVGRITAQQTLAAVAVDAGRVAVQAPSGAVTLLSATGVVLKQIAVPVGSFSGTALQGSQLVTLRNGNLEVYDVASGSLTKTIPLAAGSPKPVLRDLTDGLAVYVRGLAVHVVRLSDGKKLTITVPGAGPVDAQIESTGLYYSYNLSKAGKHGRIVFLPFAQLLTKLG